MQLSGVCRKYITSIVFLVVITISCPALAQMLLVTDIDIRQEASGEKIAIKLSKPAKYRIFQLDKPPRLVMDLPPFLWRVPENKFSQYNGRLVKNIRFARFDANTSRLVFDLTSSVELYSDMMLSADNVLTFGIRKTGAKKKPIHRSENLQERKSAAAYPIPVLKPRAAARHAVTRPMIVIDPGHGGGDPGAIGKHGTKEKDITLKYARVLRSALLKSGRYRARLTRNNDNFIRLRQRVAIARKADADLFISLHADSAPSSKARGISVYTLSEKASDKEAAALAVRENKADIISGIDLSHESEDVMDILIDLAQRETKNKSIRLADIMVRELGREVKLLPNTHRFAGFAVLKSPDVPSVLVEIGFLSNSGEEKNIRQASHRKKVVRAIVRAVDKYFSGEKSR